MSILLYGCTKWILIKRIEKKLDSNYTKMLRAILRQRPTKQQLYDHLPPIMETIQVRRTRHVEHCWRSMDELISDVLLWTPSHGRAKARGLARTFIKQVCADTGCRPEDLPEVMDEREGWRESVKDICADGATWWWWWWWCVCVCVCVQKISDLTLIGPGFGKVKVKYFRIYFFFVDIFFCFNGYQCQYI